MQRIFSNNRKWWNILWSPSLDGWEWEMFCPLNLLDYWGFSLELDYFCLAEIRDEMWVRVLISRNCIAWVWPNSEHICVEPWKSFVLINTNSVQREKLDKWFYVKKLKFLELKGKGRKNEALNKIVQCS